MITAKYMLTLTASFLAWVVPVNIPKAPKIITFLSFMASGGGFLYAFSLATPMSDQQWYQNSKRIQERELLKHDLAVEEMVLMAEIERQYLGQVEAKKEAVFVEKEQQKLSQTQERKLLPDALPDALKSVIEIIKSNGGTITQRELARKTKLKADQIQSYFRELQQRGYGNISSDGRTYSFNLTRQT